MTPMAAPHGAVSRAWQPLLGERLAARAIEAVRAIAEALEVPLRPIGDTDDQRAIEGASLAGGRAGFAVLFSYLARAGLVDDADRIAEAFLDEASAAIADVAMPPGLFSGFTGVAWTASHLAEPAVLAGDDSTDEIGEALRTYLTQSPWMDDYDLVAGLAGIGVYALERFPDAAARKLLELLIDRLDETAQPSGQGIAWITCSALLADWQRALCPRGYYNLGLAHGVPGAIAVLAGACAAGVRPATARRLLDGAVRWLLSQRTVTEAGATFPSWIAVDGEARASRLAWCYGDPGIAASLLVAARVVGEPSWEREAMDIARSAAACPIDRSGVRDAGICHGAAGLAHIFNRIYQATADEAFADAARFWFARTLDMRQSGTGIAGYRAAAGEVNGTSRWIDDPRLLTGAAGIALALLAAVSTVEPAWDRLLLLSLRPLSRRHPPACHEAAAASAHA